jgi:acyl dehydratase
MSRESGFQDIAVGKDLGTMEMTVDEKTINDWIALVQWQAKKLLKNLNIAPPGASIERHPRMEFENFPDLRAGIWAKSEHEFLKPLKIGSKIFIHGKVANKYVKRNRNYVVTEYETTDEAGKVVMSSRETGVYLE